MRLNLLFGRIHENWYVQMSLIRNFVWSQYVWWIRMYRLAIFYNSPDSPIRTSIIYPWKMLYCVNFCHMKSWSAFIWVLLGFLTGRELSRRLLAPAFCFKNTSWHVLQSSLSTQMSSQYPQVKCDFANTKMLFKRDENFSEKPVLLSPTCLFANFILQQISSVNLVLPPNSGEHVSISPWKTGRVLTFLFSKRQFAPLQRVICLYFDKNRPWSNL